MSELKVADLSLAFGGVKALDGVTFRVARGEICAMIGPNGAGKSTVLNAISRIYAPDTGSIHFGAEDLLQRAVHEIAALGIARTFQNLELFESATVMENLMIGRAAASPRSLLREFLSLASVRELERKNRSIADEILDLLQMQSVRDRRVAVLPCGVRKNVELARALCTRPQLLLLDEPASGLSPEESTTLAGWLRKIRQTLGITMLMVEHDLNLVSTLADRVLVMNNGRLLAQGSVAEVTANPAVQSAYLGQPA